MDSHMVLALERRVKLLPNRATIGIQAQIQDTTIILPKFRKFPKKAESVPTSLTEECGSKDVKIGTDPELIEYKPKSYRRVSPSALRYRLKGVLAEENTDLNQIDQSNRLMRVELSKARKYLLNKM